MLAVSGNSRAGSHASLPLLSDGENDSVCEFGGARSCAGALSDRGAAYNTNGYGKQLRR